MALSTSYRPATELTGVARAAADQLDREMVLAEWLPSRENATLDYSFDASEKPLVDVAEFSAFDAVPQYGRLGPTITKSGQLPPIRRQLPVLEFARLMLSDNTAAVAIAL
jgi:hypothetical protein